MNRRDCLKVAAGAFALSLPAAKKLTVRIGSMAGSLPAGAPDEVFAAGKRVGLEGIEFNIGREPVDGSLPLFKPDTQKRYLNAANSQGMAIAGVVLDVFHRHYLKNDPVAATFIDRGIDTCRAMKAGVLLLPFFGPAALTNRQEMGHVADIVKEHASRAKTAGVTLGLENTISAEDNAWMLDRIGSSAVKVYYDIGNSTNNGYDTPKEIRWLGGNRICQMHIKDRGYLGESGKIDVVENLRAIRDSGFSGWLNFETSSPSNNKEEDLKRNMAYLKKAMATAEES
ncbi:MAG: sugar phosphate isomerase/epimerase [Bryobacteraceae bacterium]|nr:sugar phosphate isomerase/epimerase [Bryobacteraceae bacterium]